MNKQLAKIAYEAYCAKRAWRSFAGEPLPHFEQQSADLQEAWAAAAEAVAEAIRNDARPG